MNPVSGPEAGSGPEVQQAQPDVAVDINTVTNPEVGSGTPDAGADAEDGGAVNGPEAGKPDVQLDVPFTFKDGGPDADAPDGAEAGDGGDGGDSGDAKDAEVG